MTATDDLHQAAEAYAASTGLKPPTALIAADDTQLKASALNFAKAEGYIVPPPAPSDYDAMVAALKPPQGSFGTQKVITSLSAFKAAVSNYQAGDDYLVQGVTIPGQTAFYKKLSQYARFTFDHSCVFSGFNASTWTQSDNIYLRDPNYLQLIFQPGCKIVNPKGNANFSIYGGDHLVVDGFVAGDCGGTNWHSSPVYSPLTNLWARGEVYNGGKNAVAWDPHTEKGSGFHGAYVANGKAGSTHDVMIALYTHDHPYCAGDLQMGHSISANGSVLPKNFEFYIKAKNLPWLSKIQTGGNATQCWGQLGANIVYKVIEADNIAGKAFWCGALNGGAPDIKIMSGKATNYCKNPRWAGQSPWDKHSGVSYPNPTALTPKP